MSEQPGNDSLNLSALLTITSIAPQFASFAAQSEAVYETLEEDKEDVLDMFEDEDELDSFIEDIKTISEAANQINEELMDKIGEIMNGLSNK